MLAGWVSGIDWKDNGCTARRWAMHADVRRLAILWSNERAGLCGFLHSLVPPHYTIAVGFTCGRMETHRLTTWWRASSL